MDLLIPQSPTHFKKDIFMISLVIYLLINVLVFGLFWNTARIFPAPLPAKIIVASIFLLVILNFVLVSVGVNLPSLPLK